MITIKKKNVISTKEKMIDIVELPDYQIPFGMNVELVNHLKNKIESDLIYPIFDIKLPVLIWRYIYYGYY